MNWLTRSHIHMDRTATAWLIRRFVDPQACFHFTAGGEATGAPPRDAVPFGMPGVELSAHDADGSTFRKALRKFDLAEDPHLVAMCRIVESAIALFLHEKRGRPLAETLLSREAAGLVAFSEGIAFVARSDAENLALSMGIYDALHAFCQVYQLEQARPDLSRGDLPSSHAALLPFIKQPKFARIETLELA